jgi:hypothetical protein
MIRAVLRGATAASLSVLMAACSSGGGEPTPAEHAAGAVAEALTPYSYSFGWVVADIPTGSYTPVAFDGPSEATVTNLQTGLYRVDMADVGANGGGNVQVTSYGKGAERCKVAGWYPTSLTVAGQPRPSTSVTVACHDNKGSLTNSPFILLFHAGYGTYPSTPGDTNELAYLWSNQLTGTFTPAPAYQWSTSGQLGQVTRAALGRYDVTLTGLPEVGGSVLVTAYGTGSEYCKVNYWYSTGADTVAEVLCFDNDGKPVDTLFSLSYRLNTAPNRSPWMDVSYYLWANDPSASSYVPNPTYSYSLTPPASPLGLRVTRQSTGAYQVATRKSLTWSASAFPMVTAYGSDAAYCKIYPYSYQNILFLGISVSCFLPNGATVDSRFDYAAGTLYGPGPLNPPIPIPPDWTPQD